MSSCGFSSGANGYRLATAVVDDTAADAEPNDIAARALPLVIGEEQTGRLAGPRDIDRYTFEVPQTLVASQIDVALRVGSTLDRRVCVIGPDEREVQCRQGTGDIVVSNLALAGGTHKVIVEGDEDLDHHYGLSVVDVGNRSAAREVEPNDSAATASAFDPAVTVGGRSANNDLDHYLITTTGAPQLWRLDASGLSTGGFGHPECSPGATAIGEGLPISNPISGPSTT